MKRLIHYSSAPLGELYNRDHTEHGGGAFKTPGLWLSVEGEDDWASWCKSDNFSLGPIATEVILHQKSGVLWVDGARAFDAFAEEFRSANPFSRFGRNFIDWPKVRARYRGLIIAPYLWERRLSDHIWYYSWDCVSGVIWDVSAVAETRALRSSEGTYEQSVEAVGGASIASARVG